MIHIPAAVVNTALLEQRVYRLASSLLLILLIIVTITVILLVAVVVRVLGLLVRPVHLT